MNKDEGASFSSLQNVVLIGAGRMGMAHAMAIRELGLCLHAICDASQTKLDAAQQQFDVPEKRCYLDARDLFSEIQRPDLVIIATTANFHCELTCLAARAGTRRILCEKPLATSLRDCETMIEACRKSGTILAVNHQMRFMPQYAIVKEALTSTHFGAMASMNVVGGCMGVAMNGSHYIEAFRFISEDEPQEISAWFHPTPLQNPRGQQFFDAAGQIRVIGKHGKRLYLDIGSDQGHGMLSVYATQYGHLFVDELGGAIRFTCRKKEHLGEPMSRYGMPCDHWQTSFTVDDNVQSTKKVLVALLKAENYPDAEVGKKVVTALVAAYVSSESKKPVDLSAADLPFERSFPWA